MKLVILESPYAGDVERNVHYARRCLHDSLLCGEAPIVSHLLYTQEGVLDDNNPQERALGITAGHAWYKVTELCAVYCDLGLTRGMKSGINIAQQYNIPIEFRLLDDKEAQDALDRVYSF